MGEVVIRSDELEVVVTPQKGCDIRQVRLRRTGETVLWETPWTPQPASPSAPWEHSARAWLASYPGGWQLLLPNGGDPCVVEGVEHVFHGEASVARWEYDSTADELTARLSCYELPLTIARSIRVHGADVVVEDEVRNTSQQAVRFIWGHHPGFGGDLLEGGARIHIAGTRVLADAGYDPPGNAVRPGAEGPWPFLEDHQGRPVDLRDPREAGSLFAYVDGLTEGVARVTRNDGALGVELRWDHELFSAVWLWEELGGSLAAPWFGRGRVVGIEPCSTIPGHGLGSALATGSSLVELAGGQSRVGRITLTVTTAG